MKVSWAQTYDILKHKPHHYPLRVVMSKLPVIL